MIDFNNLEEIKKLDPKDVYGSTELFVKQLEQIRDISNSLRFPPGYKNIKNVVICGMGGSAYGGHVALSLFASNFKVPVVTISDYHLPGFVNKDSLVLLVSYSGTTEETLSCADEALRSGAKIAVLTTGGKLGILAGEHAGLVFDPKLNPSGQPRLGTGYIVLGTIVLLSKVGVITLSDKEIDSLIEDVKASQASIKESSMKLSQDFYNYIPVIFAAEHLVGNAHIIRNQINETAKSFSVFEDLPELNHHLMEGLKNPKGKKLRTLMLSSDKYSERLRKRLKLTHDVVNKNDIPSSTLELSGSSKISECFNALSFGGYFTLFLGLAYGQDPSLIPWVDYFKEKLAK